MSRLPAFGPYQLVERIGVGAMGEVYRAVGRRDGRVVALKRLMASASNAESVAGLVEEAELARALDHPAIARLADVGQVEGVHYIAYDYVPGRDLRAIQERATGRGLSRRRSSIPDGAAREAQKPQPIPVDVAVHIVLRVAEALAHAHACCDARGTPLRLVHRDVSPTNILVSFDGAVKLLDFGIARTASRLLRTDTGQIKGTVGYMSPEQVRGEPVDARSDIYSLGVCFWELCVGRRLFDAAEPVTVAARVLTGDVPPPRAAGAKISAELESIVRKALAPEREGRYASVSLLHADLERQAGAEGLLADSIRVARYVRSLFPEFAAEEAARREECVDMADSKGGSDLDVFEGLAKKAARPTAPGLAPPPGAPRKSTLLGGLGPLPPPATPGARAKSTPPPPTVVPGGTPTPGSPPPGTPPPTTTPSAGSAALPPPAPPPASTGRKPGSLPPPAPPPAKAGTLPGLATPPPFPAPSKSGSLPSTLPSASGGGSVAPPPAKSSTLPGLPAPLPPPKPLPPPSMPPPVGASAPGPLPAPTRPPAPYPPAPSAVAGSTPQPLPPPAMPAKPLPPPAPPPQKGKAAVDMDWDDDEESTHVYDKGDKDDAPQPKNAAKNASMGAAAALLANSGGAARAAQTPAPAPATVPPSVPPPPPPIPVSPYEERLRRDAQTEIRPRAALLAQAQQQPQGGGNRLAVLLGGAALVVALIVLALTLMPKKGAIKINVASRTGAPVGAADVYIDGHKRCEATPCPIADLDLGQKTIKIIANGFVPAEQNETIEANTEKVITILLDPSGAAPAPVAAGTGQLNAGTGQTGVGIASAGGTGIKIGCTDGEKSVRVSVDGTDKGTLPVELRDLAPGSHKIRFDGGDRYQNQEKTVDVVAGQMTDLGELKLKVIRGRVTLNVVTKDAIVTLVRRDKKMEKKLTDEYLKRPLDIDTSESWRLVATKKGFDDFTQDLTFEDGQAEKTIKIELFEAGKAAPPATPPPVAVAPPVERTPPPERTPTPPVERTPPPEKTAAPPPAENAASGTATLNINSIPPSKVLLDGKPLGSTPKTGVSVSPGSHTVTFIHPDLGRETKSVTVKAGETKTAAHKFKQPE